jgi:hypothetical protein
MFSLVGSTDTAMNFESDKWLAVQPFQSSNQASIIDDPWNILATGERHFLFIFIYPWQKGWDDQPHFNSITDW